MNFSWLEFCFQKFFEKIFCYTLVFQTDLVMGRGRVEKMKRKVFVYDSIFFAIVNNLFWNLPWSHRAFSGARLLPISIYHKWIIFFLSLSHFPTFCFIFCVRFLIVSLWGKNKYTDRKPMLRRITEESFIPRLSSLFFVPPHPRILTFFLLPHLFFCATILVLYFRKLMKHAYW